MLDGTDADVNNPPIDAGAEEEAEDTAQEQLPPADAAEPSGHESGSVLPSLHKGWAVFPSLLQRYYTTYTTSNHQALHVHSNGLCLLGLTPSHPSLQPPLRVTAVAFRDHDSKNLLQNDVRGKKKAGAIFLLPRDMVSLSDGSSFVVYACIRGSVIEVNRRLLTHPELLADPSGAGYLLVLRPKLDEKRSIGQACVEFDRETPLNEPSGNAKRKLEGKRVRSSSSKRQARERPSCWAFERGSCQYGDRCRFQHVISSASASKAATAPSAADSAAADPAEDGGGHSDQASAARS